MAEESHPTHLSPSELGTKDYWETFYARTLAHLSTKQTPSSTTAAAKSSRLPQTNPTSDSDDEEDDEDSEDEIDDDSDPGTSWFSEHNAPDKVLQFLTDEGFPLAPCHTRKRGSRGGGGGGRQGDGDGQDEQQPCILDLGTGNGSMLALLRKKGKFEGEMVGVDYSPRSVELARELQRLRIHSAYLSDSDSDGDFSDDEEEAGAGAGAEGEGEDGNENGVVKGDADKDTNIRFEEWDILSSTDALSGSGDGERRLDWFPYAKGGFDIVLDKGTFDAVSLSDETVESTEPLVSKTTGSGTKKIQKRVCERYPDIARRLVRKGGFLVVTSCNWTEEELVQWFTRSEGGEAEDKLQVWGRVEYPRFRFGGKEGQGVCTVCFQRV
ncbi:putative S-adenosylmethionine-dependent methyltransferase [Aspergillus melleus]|uniref:putative S-adenosylmethionine-dependent methyltransferase n=1 Tax=Aspergillus melleus TaxID=138277 RepID=UPI001E8E5569|nr:Protein-lysine N-methyltransferase efm4 [Aspergillus melleus]KAH8423286.1 Protein-lysine N-methyltransferase efm4 [Aspergillus melleus]